MGCGSSAAHLDDDEPTFTKAVSYALQTSKDVEPTDDGAVTVGEQVGDGEDSVRHQQAEHFIENLIEFVNQRYSDLHRDGLSEPTRQRRLISATMNDPKFWKRQACGQQCSACWFDRVHGGSGRCP
jgi:hypothetical protein